MTRRRAAGPSRCGAPTASTRTMRPRHVVMATGVSGIANLPDIPTLKNFQGHAAAFQPLRGRRELAGKRAMVIGTGNSGHDIAQDLYSSGAEVTLVQRCADADHQYRAVGAARLRDLQ